MLPNKKGIDSRSDWEIRQMHHIEKLTELKLHHWRGGSLDAERMCAEIVSLEGFSQVDPQSPLGGPDGTKDILVQSGNQKYVCAVYFPTTPSSFQAIKKKFIGDLKGVSKNQASGIVFLTNQHLKPSTKKILRNLATTHECILYDLEAIRAILDNPKGYGLRLAHVDIPMTPEEQLSFVTHYTRSVNLAVSRNTDVLQSLVALLTGMQGNIDPHGQSTFDPSPGMATRQPTPLRLTGSASSLPQMGRLVSSAVLDVPSLCSIHFLLTIGTQAQHRGELRQMDTWIGTADSTRETAAFVPSGPSEVPDLLDDLLTNWRNRYQVVLAGPLDEKLETLVKFHYQFLRIHPFADANGRMAQLLLELQAHELLGVSHSIQMDDGAAHYAALQEAHKGDMNALAELIQKAVFGRH